jgi:hypothetical protein
LFGEDRESKFENSYKIEMYIQSSEFYGGEGDIMSKFGLEVKDTLELVVSVPRFNEVVPNQSRPNEGDLIYFPITNYMFQVDFVEDEKPFYNLGGQYVYILNVSLMNYNNEKFNTNDSIVDEMPSIYSNNNSTADDPFADNEEIAAEADLSIEFTESNPFGEP